MSTLDQLITGLELTVTGMVTVFLLLSLMVLVIGLMSRAAHRLRPPSRHQTPLTDDMSDGHLDPVLVSAISAAVHRYRHKPR